MPNESRNTQHAIPPTAQPGQGVGGRQEDAPPATQGGGYLSSCSASGAPLSAREAAATDPRLAELREMGIHPLWIIVASSIGLDAFVRQWEVFSAHMDLLDGRNRITLPSIKTYRRFQRNQAIRSMLLAGKPPKEVSEELRKIDIQTPKLTTLRRIERRMKG